MLYTQKTGRSARLLLDLASHQLPGKLVAFNVGYDGEVYVVYTREPIEQNEARHAAVQGQPPPVEWHWASCVADPGEHQGYRVLAFHGEKVTLDLTVENAPSNVHDVQPLGDRVLLLCDELRGERNGLIYERDGTLGADLPLGDGVLNIQTTSRGLIWTAYGDEAVYGPSPIGQSGLVAWDAAGTARYRFEPTAGLERIDDCYALNVASDDDVWCYYPAGRSLVHVRNFEIIESWVSPVEGSTAFAVDRDHALIWGGYHDWSHECLLCKVAPGAEPEIIDEFWLADEMHQGLHGDRVVGRGGSLHVLRGTKVYTLDVADILDAV